MEEKFEIINVKGFPFGRLLTFTSLSKAAALAIAPSTYTVSVGKAITSPDFKIDAASAMSFLSKIFVYIRSSLMAEHE